MDNITATKVLFVVGDLGIGGVQSGIMNFVRIISRENVCFDILIHSDEIGFYEKEFSQYGQVYHLPIRKGKNKITSLILLIYNSIMFRYRLVCFLKKHEGYDAIHCKSMYYCAASVEAGRTVDIPVRVVQCHIDKPHHLSIPYRLYFKWNSNRIERNATCKLAVTEKAAKMLYGKHEARIIKNPTINLERLDPTKYTTEKHSDIRLIQIGTYSRRKNQCFSVDILRELLGSGQEASLSFIGFSLDEPNYINTIEQKIKQCNLQDKVSFYSKDADVPFLLSQSDYMLIPSLREGLPNVALEAQAMGVPCFLSDNITSSTDCGLCIFLPLSEGPKFWAQEILRYKQKNGTEKKYVDMSAWDQRKIVEEYIHIWQGNC